MNDQILQPLIQRAPNSHSVLSLYLDMSVNSENKRTHQLFLQQKRAEYPELDSDRSSHHREPLGEALERAERWLEANYAEANRGVALFLELTGDWIQGIQLPVALDNRLLVGEVPILAPLVELLTKHPHYGIALVDREHCRIGGLHLGQIQHYRDIEPEAYPTAHDVHKGGWAARGYQSYKAEETRQFYRMFASDLSDCDRKYNCEHWILLGTAENVRNFREYLPRTIDERIIHTAHSSVDSSDADIVERLQPFMTEHVLQDEASTVDTLRDRLRTGHFAIAGVRDTLEQLQEGKVETLVIARDFHKEGAQCTRCNFYLDRHGGGCPYCGGELREGVDLVESMIRMASAQEVDLEFVDPRPLTELNGVGALLKF